MFLAIDHTVPDHHKHMEFATEVEAQAHIDDNLPNGFVAESPGGSAKFWIVDPVTKTVTLDTAAETSAQAIRKWNKDMATAEVNLPTWFEDVVTEGSVVLKPGVAKDNYDAKVVLRAAKP